MGKFDTILFIIMYVLQLAFIASFIKDGIYRRKIHVIRDLIPGYWIIEVIRVILTLLYDMTIGIIIEKWKNIPW